VLRFQINVRILSSEHQICNNNEIFNIQATISRVCFTQSLRGAPASALQNIDKKNFLQELSTIRGCQCSIIRRILSHVFSTKNTFFQPLKSDWSKPKKAALITVTAIICVFGYYENDNLFFPKVICRKWRTPVSFVQSASKRMSL